MIRIMLLISVLLISMGGVGWGIYKIHYYNEDIVVINEFFKYEPKEGQVMVWNDSEGEFGWEYVEIDSVICEVLICL